LTRTTEGGLISQPLHAGSLPTASSVHACKDRVRPTAVCMVLDTHTYRHHGTYKYSSMAQHSTAHMNKAAWHSTAQHGTAQHSRPTWRLHQLALQAAHILPQPLHLAVAAWADEHTWWLQQVPALQLTPQHLEHLRALGRWFSVVSKQGHSTARAGAGQSRSAHCYGQQTGVAHRRRVQASMYAFHASWNAMQLSRVTQLVCCAVII
jgi:hypothetical protein